MNNNESIPENTGRLPANRSLAGVTANISRIGLILCVACIFTLVVVGQPLLPNPFQSGVPITDVQRISGAEVKNGSVPGPRVFRRAVISESGKRLTVTDENSTLIFTAEASPSNRTTFDNAKQAVFDAEGNVCVLDFRVAGIGETCEERVIKFSRNGVYLGELYKYVYSNTDLAFEFTRILDIAVHGNSLYILRGERRSGADDGYPCTLEKTDANAAVNVKQIYSISNDTVHPFSDAPKLTNYRTNAQIITKQTDTPPYPSIEPESETIINALRKPEIIGVDEIIEPVKNPIQLNEPRVILTPLQLSPFHVHFRSHRRQTLASPQRNLTLIHAQHN